VRADVQGRPGAVAGAAAPSFAISRHATVDWTGGLRDGSGVVSIPSEVLRNASVTYATRLGEPEGHTSPEELLAAAHASCFAMSLAATLGTHVVPFEGLLVQATLTLGRVEGRLRLIGAQLAVELRADSVDAAALDAAVAEADSRCPVSTALRATMPVRVEISLISSL
jgi:osmotically inducible protein OsmC